MALPLAAFRVLLGLLPLLAALPLAWAVSRRLGHPGGLLEVLIAWLWVLLLQGLVLGSLGWLNAPGIVSFSLALAGAGLLAMRSSRPDSDSRREGDSVAVFVAVAAVWAVPGLWIALTLPATNFDSLAYHLPTLAHWVRSGSLEPAPFLGLQQCFPMSLMALTVPLVSLGRHDVLASLVALLAIPVFGLAVAGLAHQLGAQRREAIGAALVALTVPATLRTVGSVQPDLMLAGVFIASLAAAVASGRSGSPRHLASFALCIALLPGWKTSGWIYAVISTLFWMAWQHRTAADWTADVRKATGRSLAVGGVLLFTMGFWSVRSLLNCGSAFSLGQMAHTPTGSEWTLAEVMRTTILSAFRPTSAADWRAVEHVVITGLGLPFLAYLAIAGGSLLWRIADSGSAKNRSGYPLRGLILALLNLTLLAYLGTPFSADNGAHGYRLSAWSVVQVRFALPFVGLVAAAAAVEVSRHRRGWVFTLGMALIASVLGLRSVYDVVWRDVGWTVLIAAAIGCAFYLLRSRRRARRAGMTIGLVAAVFLLVYAAERRDALRRVAYGPFFAQVQEVVEPGAPIASYGVDRIYPLFGPRFGRDVVTRGTPRSDREQWRNDRDAWTAEMLEWLDSLETGGVDHLVTRERDPSPRFDGRGSSLYELLAYSTEWQLSLNSDDRSYLALFSRVDGWGGASQ